MDDYAFWRATFDEAAAVLTIWALCWLCRGLAAAKARLKVAELRYPRKVETRITTDPFTHERKRSHV